MAFLFTAIGFLLSGYYATWQVALLERGFSLAELASLLAVANFISISVDVPTGMIADRIGHKFSVLAGLVVYALGFLCPVMIAGPYGIAATVISIAVGDALVEGALDSWVADVKAAQGSAISNHSYMGLDQLQRLGMIAGAIVVPSFISYIGDPVRWSWSIYSILSVVVLVIAFRIPRGRVQKLSKVESKPQLSDLVGHLREPVLLMLLAGAFIFGLSDGALQTGFWPRVKELNITDPLWLGVIQSSMSLSRVVGLQLWKRSKNVESIRIPGIALLGSGVFYGLFAAGLLGKASIAFWMLRIVVLSAFFSAQRVLIQKLYSESKWRATVASGASTMTQIGVILFSLAVGVFGVKLGITSGAVLATGAVLTFVAGGVYLKVGH